MHDQFCLISLVNTFDFGCTADLTFWAFYGMDRCFKGQPLLAQFYAHDDQVKALRSPIFKRSKRNV